MPFDAESARAAQAKSAASKARRRDPNQKAREALSRAAAGAAGVVVSTALASDGFEEVRPELRFQAAKLVLEYVFGKQKGSIDDEDVAGGEEPSAADFESLLKPVAGPRFAPERA